MRTDIKMIKIPTEESGTLNIYKYLQRVNIDAYVDTIILTHYEAKDLIKALQDCVGDDE